MKKILGILGLLIVITSITAIMNPDAFLSGSNLQNTLKLVGMYGFIAIGVAFVIITGGIDLSIGSVMALVGVLFPIMLFQWHVPLILALPGVLVVAALVGMFHGLLITKLGLQPFIVTLFGLLFYRGLARTITDGAIGFQSYYMTLKHNALSGALELITGGYHTYDIPMPFIYMILVAIVAAFFLNRTIWGRYLLALGRNEQAAKFSGIRTDGLIICSYVISSLMAGVAAIFFSLDSNSVQPSSFGNFYELYAIAAAVLGGCSLRGGEGSILGVIIGTMVLRVLYNAINLLKINTEVEFSVIGAVILLGVIADELVRRFAARRAAAGRARLVDPMVPNPPPATT